ncbi:hypothetical protein [Acetobacter fallax]|uniref:Transposase n=1 Tax=Acetobacter fallax TaxID=1737473 RepID=A0ABX0KAE1_9PROT|nr:hypothetical protein [Acetobacter fallax]NHO33370.1 hypothetical protein [Acetobacter fallax]NHO36989.1 hypothetical protein [Acetobacter fallax]
MKQHKVMPGARVLYQAAQLSHAEVFAAARRSEGMDCHVVPDVSGTKRAVRINPLTGRGRRRSGEAGCHCDTV